MNEDSDPQPPAIFKPADPPTSLKPNLDQYDSVRKHLQRRLSQEVADLEARIAILRNGRAPHNAIIIATYERMVTRKLSFMDKWNMCKGSRSRHLQD